MVKVSSAKKSAKITAAPTGQEFVFISGEIAATPEDLLRLIKIIPDWAYAHHTSLARNDFANWLNDVFAWKLIAKKIRQAKSLDEVEKILSAKLN